MIDYGLARFTNQSFKPVDTFLLILNNFHNAITNKFILSIPFINPREHVISKNNAMKTIVISKDEWSNYGIMMNEIVSKMFSSMNGGQKRRTRRIKKSKPGYE